MAKKDRREPPGPTDPEQGVWQGTPVARRFVSPDGLTVLVGRDARANDLVTVKLGRPRDFWLHVAGESGSHVVVRNPDGLDRLPRQTQQFAASLAAYYSKARRGGKVAVHLARCADVTKGRGMEPGKVVLARYKTVHATPREPESSCG